MYDVYYYPDATTKQGTLIHSSSGQGNKIISGKLVEALNTVTTFEFTIGLQNTLYYDVKPFKGIVRVVNPMTQKEVFYGRILKPKSNMANSGLFSQSFVAEDPRAFLNDSIQPYNRYPYTNEFDVLYEYIYEHNKKVEDFKQFEVGVVDVENINPPNWFYSGFETTLETVRSRVEKVGGYITVERKNDIWLLNWTTEIGRLSTTQIEIGKNLKSSSRSNALENMATRIIPKGKQNGIPWDDEGAITDRLGIESVNDGVPYLDDEILMNEFGIIEKVVEFDDIWQANLLLDAGFKYRDEQHTYLTSWDVSVVDLSLIDPTKEPLEVGNFHPVNNPPIAGIEVMQITRKETDVLRPQAVVIKLGEIERKLSTYHRSVAQGQKALKESVSKPVDGALEAMMSEYYNLSKEDNSEL